MSVCDYGDSAVCLCVTVGTLWCVWCDSRDTVVCLCGTVGSMVGVHCEVRGTENECELGCGPGCGGWVGRVDVGGGHRRGHLTSLVAPEGEGRGLRSSRWREH